MYFILQSDAIMKSTESDYYSYIEDGIQSSETPIEAVTYENGLTQISGIKATKQSDVYENGQLSLTESVYVNPVTRASTSGQACVYELANSSNVKRTEETLIYENNVTPIVKDLGQNNEYFELEKINEYFELDKRIEYFELENRNAYFELEKIPVPHNNGTDAIHSRSSMEENDSGIFGNSDSNTYDQLGSSKNSNISDAEDDLYNHLQDFSTDYDLFGASKQELVIMQTGESVEELP